MLAALKTSGRFAIFAYANYQQHDETSARLQHYCQRWRDVTGLAGDTVCQQIQRDGIDILIDLSGHTRHHRLDIFAQKPAPLQVTWLGYFATTGVAQIDALLADHTGLPEEQQRYFTERIHYLPETRLCFTAPADAPDVAPAPFLSRGFITFGCFQAVTKINDSVLATWAKILQALPTSRLRVQNKFFDDAAGKQNFLERCIAQGIVPQRLLLVGSMERVDYLAAYGEVDMLLDTFPYPGGTTTCEALWMGVPTVTLAGSTLIARQGASLLTAAGLSEWVTDSIDAYIYTAIHFARAAKHLSYQRQNLRSKMAASALFDASRFARHFEAAMLTLWQQQTEQYPKEPYMTQRKTFLHVGCGPNSKDQTTNGFNNDAWIECRFDIDERVQPDLVGSMTDMSAVPDASVDAIFSSHNIEHLYPHEVAVALKEFLRVLKPDGFLVITCPDLQSVCALVAEDKLTETAYTSPAGTIAPIDILYGHRQAMAQGNLFMAHRCGFTQIVLDGTLRTHGFQTVASMKRAHPAYDLWAVASKSSRSEEIMRALAMEHFPE